MKILVTLKRVPDASQKTKIQNGMIDVSSVSWQLNQFDEYALEAALRLTENAANPAARLGEVVVVAMGPAEVQTHLRTALAMGADRALWVQAEEKDLDASVVAQGIHALVQKEQPTLVLLGKLAADGEGNEVGQRLAGLLGWPQATFASSVVLSADKKTLLVGREVDLGIEYKKIPLPAVVTVDLRIVASQAVQNGVTLPTHAYAEGARFASLKGIMAAKKKPLESLSSQQLGVSLSKQVETVRCEQPPARKTGVKVESAAELVRKLHQEAKVV